MKVPSNSKKPIHSFLLKKYVSGGFSRCKNTWPICMNNQEKPILAILRFYQVSMFLKVQVISWIIKNTTLLVLLFGWLIDNRLVQHLEATNLFSDYTFFFFFKKHEFKKHEAQNGKILRNT